MLVFGAIRTATRAAAASSTARVLRSNPVAPTRSGTSRSPQARACSATRCGTLKSMATAAPASASPGSAVTRTPVGGPSAAASCLSLALELEASAPQSVRGAAARSRNARSTDCPMRPVIPKIASPATLVHRAGEKLLHPFEERLLARLVTALLKRGLEFLEQLLLLGRKSHGRLDDHAAEQVPGRTAAHRTHALLAHAEHPAGLSFARNLENDLAIERRHLHRTPERGRREADRDLAGQMAPLALEDRMLAYADLDVQIARGSAVAPRFALPVQTDAIAAIDAGGNIHRERLLLPHASLAVAGVARVTDDLAAALGARARLLNRENGLLHAHLTLPVAGITDLGRGPFGRSRPVADLALRERGNLDLGVGAEHGLLEVELELEAQIGAPEHLRAAALAAGEDVAEHLAENVAEGLPGAEPAAAPTLEAGVPELVVDRALLRVAEHLVSFLGLLEFVF